jgi:hypothetical protein
VRVKAIQDFAQLSDTVLFAEIATGTAPCVSNAKRIHDDALALVEPERPRGAEILRVAAKRKPLRS